MSGLGRDSEKNSVSLSAEALPKVHHEPPQHFVLAHYGNTPGTYWCPQYIPRDDTIVQRLSTAFSLVIDPASEQLPQPPVQIFVRSICVSYLIASECLLQQSCPHLHKGEKEIQTEVRKRLRRENTVGTIPESVDISEQKEPCVSTEKIAEWVKTQPRFWLATFSTNRVILWLRRFEEVVQGRPWDSSRWLITPLQGIVLVCDPHIPDLAHAEPIQLYSRLICKNYFQSLTCDRPNCTLLHRLESELREAVGKRYFELKAMGKLDRLQQIVHFDSTGQPTQLSTTQLLRLQLEQKEARRTARLTMKILQSESLTEDSSSGTQVKLDEKNESIFSRKLSQSGHSFDPLDSLESNKGKEAYTSSTPSARRNASDRPEVSDASSRDSRIPYRNGSQHHSWKRRAGSRSPSRSPKVARATSSSKHGRDYHCSPGNNSSSRRGREDRSHRSEIVRRRSSRSPDRDRESRIRDDRKGKSNEYRGERRRSTRESEDSGGYRSRHSERSYRHSSYEKSYR